MKTPLKRCFLRSTLSKHIPHNISRAAECTFNNASDITVKNLARLEQSRLIARKAWFMRKHMVIRPRDTGVTHVQRVKRALQSIAWIQSAVRVKHNHISPVLALNFFMLYFCFASLYNNKNKKDTHGVFLPRYLNTLRSSKGV